MHLKPPSPLLKSPRSNNIFWKYEALFVLFGIIHAQPVWMVPFVMNGNRTNPSINLLRLNGASFLEFPARFTIGQLNCCAFLRACLGSRVYLNEFYNQNSGSSLHHPSDLIESTSAGTFFTNQSSNEIYLCECKSR